MQSHDDPARDIYGRTSVRFYGNWWNAGGIDPFSGSRRKINSAFRAGHHSFLLRDVGESAPADVDDRHRVVLFRVLMKRPQEFTCPCMKVPRLRWNWPSTSIEVASVDRFPVWVFGYADATHVFVHDLLTLTPSGMDSDRRLGPARFKDLGIFLWRYFAVAGHPDHRLFSSGTESSANRFPEVDGNRRLFLNGAVFSWPLTRNRSQHG